MTKLAIAIPFGTLKIPTNENIKPKSQTSQPKTGIQPTKMAIKDSTNPAVQNCHQRKSISEVWAK